MPSRKPYGDTAVPAERSMGAILTMLRARGISSRWSEMVCDPATGDKVILQMLWSQDGAAIRARIETRIRPPDPPARKGPARLRQAKPRTAKQEATALDGERKRVLRVLHWWLKSQFEAVDAGLLTTVEVMLPFLEVGAVEGSPTVADLLKQHAGVLGRGPGSLVRALGGGSK
mgnify:CR=1 FL=1